MGIPNRLATAVGGDITINMDWWQSAAFPIHGRYWSVDLFLLSLDLDGGEFDGSLDWFV